MFKPKTLPIMEGTLVAVNSNTEELLFSLWNPRYVRYDSYLTTLEKIKVFEDENGVSYYRTQLLGDWKKETGIIKSFPSVGDIFGFNVTDGGLEPGAFYKRNDWGRPVYV